MDPVDSLQMRDCALVCVPSLSPLAAVFALPAAPFAEAVFLLAADDVLSFSGVTLLDPASGPPFLPATPTAETAGFVAAVFFFTAAGFFLDSARTHTRKQRTNHRSKSAIQVEMDVVLTSAICCVRVL